MKTCLRNCKIGDIVVWNSSGVHYRVTHPFDGDVLMGIGPDNEVASFYECYLNSNNSKFANRIRKIIKKSK